MSFFEILSEDGLQRKGRFMSGISKDSKDWAKTPSLVVPINDFLLGVNDYVDIIRGNSNIVLQVFEGNQAVPTALTRFSILFDSNRDYYSQEGKSEISTVLNDGNSEKDESLCILSKNCPSSSISSGFKKILIDELKKELQLRLENPRNSEKKHETIGLGFNFEDPRNFMVDMKSAVDLIKDLKLTYSITLIKLNGIFDNFMHFKGIIDSILYLRENIPSDTIIYASGRIMPSQYALLAYLGIDLIDATYMIFSGLSDLYYHEGRMNWRREIRNTDNLPCPCQSCKELESIINSLKPDFAGFVSRGSTYAINSEYGDSEYGDSERGNNNSGDSNINQLIAMHNFESALAELKAVRCQIDRGTLRSHMLKKSINNTFLISAIRFLDAVKPNPVEFKQGLNKNSKLLCPTELSYHDPQIHKFRRLVSERTFPRENMELCVLLPCSMTKPYSRSKSHRKFIKILKRAGKNYPRIQQAIVTSPLGLVPREIEEIYPAAHYDISVTGKWDVEEIALTSECVLSWLKKVPKAVPIVAHLSGGYLESFEKAIESGEFNGNKVIYSKTLDDLDSAIANIFNPGEASKPRKIGNSLSQEEILIKSIADFQFGVGAGELLIGTTARFLLSRNEKYKEIAGFESYGKILLGRYERASGRIRLNIEGGERLSNFPNDYLKLNISLAELKGSTIFPPILDNLDLNLCSGDEVIIKDVDGKFVGIGNMVVNAKTAMKMRRGPIAKIRKKIKK